VVREEVGVLPMPWTQPRSSALASPLRAGYQGGFFHPATGYSFPCAVRLACHVAAHVHGDVLGRELDALVREHRAQARYAYALNRLLFHCFAPDAMWNVFARFYRLPEPLIHRFYALALSRLDRARILVGRPPRGLSLTHAVSGLK
jgi:lycopene beta-cyclase